jgi:hypothetical protein
MQRLKDYTNFTAWFGGLGYALAQPFVQAQDLPLVLHVAGSAALVFALTQFVLHFLQRAADKAVPSDGAAKIDDNGLPPRPWPQVKPRAQFGLRLPPR